MKKYPNNVTWDREAWRCSGHGWGRDLADMRWDGWLLPHWAGGPWCWYAALPHGIVGVVVARSVAGVSGNCIHWPQWGSVVWQELFCLRLPPTLLRPRLEPGTPPPQPLPSPRRSPQRSAWTNSVPISAQKSRILWRNLWKIGSLKRSNVSHSQL